MDFNEYQSKAALVDVSKTCTNPNYLYYILGICGEAGELAEKIKKLIRDQKGNISEQTKNEIKLELGDIQWYCSRLAAVFGIEFNEVAEANLEKLFSRKKRNKLHGNGDYR